MKNEIGRKLTSLTIMAIMFAGGMSYAVPGMMPEAAADFSATDGLLSVSSVYIQGGAILEIVVNDPAYSSTSEDISNGPTVLIGGTEHATNQAANGKWYVYAVDLSVSTALDADGDGMEYGFKCASGLGVSKGVIDANSSHQGDVGVANILADADDPIWAEISNAATSNTGATAILGAGSCLNAANNLASIEASPGTTARSLMSDAVLQNAPSLSNHNGETGNSTTVDLGQRGHALNESGYGSWPYILAFEFDTDNLVEYGSDNVNVEFGNNGNTGISLLNNSPSDSTHLHLSITDPALNIDPTTADKWIFDLHASDSTDHQLFFANNHTDTNAGNTAISLAEMGDMGFSGNGRLANSTASAKGIISGGTSVMMTESGANTATFDSWAVNGTSQLTTIPQAVGDKKVVFTYGGDSADMIITYNSADLSIDSGGGDWLAGETATVTLTDSDLNKQPGVTETLSIGDPSAVIPTIKMGNPLTLANSTGNNNLKSGTANENSGVEVGSGTGTPLYTLSIYNTTDNSERLRIIHSAFESAAKFTGGAAATNTWINVTTAHDSNALINLAGTTVLNYDVSGPAGDLSSTKVEVYLTSSGSNTTNNAGGKLSLVTSGNARSGVVDLDDDSTKFILSTDVATGQTGLNDGLANTNDVSVAFKITHPVGTFLNTTHDYAIAADFCNFDQDNGSNVHNCIYRIEAEETGDNTGVFTGEVSYVMLNNSTSRDSDNGEHDGNDEEVEGLVGTSSDAVTVVLMNGVSGSDSVRVVYNDTDALQQADKIGVQLEAITHSGTGSLDADTYEAADMATITIVDADLNQDSSIRDTYENSSRTFQMNVTGSEGVPAMPFATKPMTIIETSNDSGIFVGTFKVPDKKGQDMSLTYYDSRDASGSANEVYDEATVVSNSGSVSFDRSVYPVPFASADLRTGANGESGQTESGNVTMTITVSDDDFGDDTLTTSGSGAAGTILVKLIEGATTTTCFTAGSASAKAGQIMYSSTPQELGPLSATEVDSGVFEVTFTVDEVQHCGTMQTITSGDVMQVQYVDAANDAGVSGTVYDSSTFDLRTGSLSVDKDVYVLGSDMVITLTDPDLDLDGGSAESYALSLIEWDSDADSSELLNDTDNFTANPSSLTETGSNTGVFQSVVTLPSASLYPGGNTGSTKVTIDYGEAVTLTYVDVGLSGEDTTEADVLDVEAYFSISNFGALIELDKAVYNWTDTVYVTITSPDHNVNSASEEQIGTTALPIQATSRSGKLCSSEKTYKADEDGPNTGVFAAEIALQGFKHQMSSDASDSGSATTGVTGTGTACGSTSTGGTLMTSGQTDGISVSYEYNDGSVIVASASIVWNIGEAGFDSSVASAGGSAVFTVVDPDENIDGTITDAFTVGVYSDSDAGGFTLTMNETDEDTGVFEGTVFFTADGATSGSNLRVSEGDTVTAEYTDETLPEPYTSSDDLTIAGTLTIGTAFPPLERAPAANARVVDAFGSSVAEVSSGQQVQIAADVSNGQSKDQAFAYLVQVQDGNGVTVSLAWITGSLTAGQSMSPALSWTPDASGTYTATVFVWESVDNPTALSPTVSVDIDVV